jgi:hypothetical protein
VALDRHLVEFLGDEETTARAAFGLLLTSSLALLAFAVKNTLSNAKILKKWGNAKISTQKTVERNVCTVRRWAIMHFLLLATSTWLMGAFILLNSTHALDATYCVSFILAGQVI